MESYLFQRYERYVKCKHPSPGFEQYAISLSYYAEPFHHERIPYIYIYIFRERERERENRINIYLCSCLNFWDEGCWFLSLRVFGLLSSSLLLFPQRFGRYVLRPSSGVCRTMTELRTTSFIETTGVACSDSVSHNRVQVLSIPVLLLVCSEDWTGNLQMIVSLEA